MVNTLIFVALGGALGAVLRYLVGLAVAFPIGTLSVNIVGSFAIGLVWVSFANKDHALTPFLLIGVLGGFTTFSSFSLDVVRLIEQSRFGFAGGYVIASVVLSIAACAVGILIARSLAQ